MNTPLQNTRTFTDEELYQLRQVVRAAIVTAEAGLASLDESGTPWASPELRARMLADEQARVAQLRALRRAVL